MFVENNFSCLSENQVQDMLADTVSEYLYYSVILESDLKYSFH